MKINLSAQQQKIVDLKDGAYLVLASAGSGKTRVLTERIKRLSETMQGKILAITFTNKAATEIKERLNGSIKDKNVFVGTFHSFCQSILELRFKLLGYSKMPHIFEEDADRIELIKQAIQSVPYLKKEYDNQDTKDRVKYIHDALQFISTVKRELILVETPIESCPNTVYQYLYQEYQDILKSNNAIDFDDIIKLVYDLFTNNEAVVNLYRQAYSYICIDECQDLNKLQYMLLKSLCGNFKNVMLVGDTNQSIYGFNGSDSSYMNKEFVSDFQPKEFKLNENYRCSSSIIEASNALMNLDVKTTNYVIKGIFEMYPATSEDDEAQFVLDKIQGLVSLKTHDDIEGEITYDKISILARNRFVFKQVEKLLTEKGIPHYYKSGNRGIKFSSTLMKIFDLCFRIKINPQDKLHQKQLEDILNVNDISDLNKIDSLAFPIASNIGKIVYELSIDNLHLKIDELRNLFENKISNDNEKKMTIDELNDFKEHLFVYKKQSITKSLEGFKSAIALGLTHIINSREEGVCLSTVHTMKGQESEIVFLMGMDEGTCPDFRAVNNDKLEQEKNNVYVAFTRAKRFLYVTYPKQRMMPWGDYKKRNISRFIQPLIKCNSPTKT